MVMNILPGAIRRHVSLTKTRFIVISHRGNGSHHMENTGEALRSQAMDPQVHGVEFDVQLTRDHVPVVFHDRDTIRLFPSEPCRVVSETNVDSLPGITTLDQALSMLRGCTAILDIELKSYHDDADELRCLYSRTELLLQRYNLTDHAFYTSFEAHLIPDLPVYQICEGKRYSNRGFVVQDRTCHDGRAFAFYTLATDGQWTTDDHALLMRLCKTSEPIVLITDSPIRLCQEMSKLGVDFKKKSAKLDEVMK